MSKRLQKKLEKAYTKYKTDKDYRVGILNDKLLRCQVEEINKNPSLDNFISFTNCLNFFYSTRLQAAVDRENELLLSKNRIIVSIAEILKKNWKKGFKLYEEFEKKKVDTKKVEALRTLLYQFLNRQCYSFTTKVFHQLNNQYPILDRNVNLFMKKEGYAEGVNFYNSNNSYGIFYDHYKNMLKDLSYSVNVVDKVDNAIWVHVAQHQSDYLSEVEA